MSRFASACVSLAIGLLSARTALADPPTQEAPAEDETPSNTEADANDQGTSNQAGPVETNTNTSGLTREGNVIDRTGNSRHDPNKFTAPANDTAFSPDEPVTWTEAQGLSPLPRSRFGLVVALGGGTSGFTNSTMKDTAHVGGEWNLRVTFGTRTPLAVEATYLGSAQSIDALGLDNDAVLVGNGAQAALRLNALVNRPVTPFLYAGVGFRHYNIANESMNTSDVKNSDNVMEVPVGAGVGARWRGIVVDARGEFRASAFEDLMKQQSADGGFIFDANDDHAGMHRWGVNATVGYEF